MKELEKILTAGKIEESLAEESFVSFNAYRLKHPKLIWLNSSLISDSGVNSDQESIGETILNEFAYVSKGYTQGGNVYRNDVKGFLADRYGCGAEVCNGGSARCGIWQGWQVKGIGQNPLVARNMDTEHSHGKMTLPEAINEAIWGEICHQSLPYGASRTLAIITTGEYIDCPYYDSNIKMPCALAVREALIRPAHFERATFFWPEDPWLPLRQNDALRVEKSINKFFLSNKQWEDFVIKFARQVATSRVIGIPHGSLTSSNISLDGRFLDFGTISSVPDFGNYLLSIGQGGVQGGIALC